MNFVYLKNKHFELNLEFILFRIVVVISFSLLGCRLAIPYIAVVNFRGHLLAFFIQIVILTMEIFNFSLGQVLLLAL